MGEDDKEDFFINMEDITLLRQIGGFQFVPTVSADLDMVVNLTITLLRPEPPGQIVTQSGDIDNRLKTLPDALKVPKAEEMPTGKSPSDDETPFFCLLEDDNLIANLDIKTDRFLDSSANSSEAILLIHVRTRVLRGNFANLVHRGENNPSVQILQMDIQEPSAGNITAGVFLPTFRTHK